MNPIRLLVPLLLALPIPGCTSMLLMDYANEPERVDRVEPVGGWGWTTSDGAVLLELDYPGRGRAWIRWSGVDGEDWLAGPLERPASAAAISRTGPRPDHGVWLRSEGELEIWRGGTLVGVVDGTRAGRPRRAVYAVLPLTIALDAATLPLQVLLGGGLVLVYVLFPWGP